MIAYALLAALQVSPGAGSVGAGAVPAPAAASASAKDAAQAKDADRMICRNEEQTGSRLGGRHVCMSKADWDTRARANGDAASAIQTRGFQVGRPNN